MAKRFMPAVVLVCAVSLTACTQREPAQDTAADTLGMPPAATPAPTTDTMMMRDTMMMGDTMMRDTTMRDTMMRDTTPRP